MIEGAADRLREERERLGLSQRALSEAGEVHKNTQIAYEKGASPITLAYLERLTSTGLDIEYVMLGRRSGANTIVMPGSSTSSEVVLVPMHNMSVSAGGGAIVMDRLEVSGYWPFPIGEINEMSARSDQLHLLPVKGDSMSPTLNDGDWIMVDGSRRDWVDGLHVARFYEDLFVKRLQFEGRSIRLVSDNAGYRTIEIERSNEADVGAFEVIGRVIWKAGAI